MYCCTCTCASACDGDKTTAKFSVALGIQFGFRSNRFDRWEGGGNELRTNRGNSGETGISGFDVIVRGFVFDFFFLIL